MNDTRIIVEDQEFELYPDTLVEITIKSVDIGDITNRYVNQTSSFKIPFTKNNLAIAQLGNINQAQSTFPYRLKSTKLVQSGSEIINNGECELVKSDTAFNINVLGNSFSFYKAIKGKMLYDLNLNAFNPIWEDNHIENYRNATTGVVMPILDDGTFNNSTIHVEFQFPAIYYSCIINQIFIDAGYSVSGNILTSPRFLKLIQPYGRSTWEYAQGLVEPMKFYGSKTTTQGAFNPATFDIVTFDIQLTGTTLYYYNNRFTQQSIGSGIDKSFLHDFTCQLTYHYLGAGNGPFKIDMVKVDYVTTAITVLDTFITSTVDATFTLKSITSSPRHVIMNPNDYVEVRISALGGGAFSTYFLNGTGFFYNEPSLQPATDFGSMKIDISHLMPEVSQSDYIKDFLIRFGIIFYEKNKTIYLKSINEIISDTANSFSLTRFAESNKPVTQSTSYLPLIYGLNNYLKHKIPDDVTTLTLGQGLFVLSNFTNLSDKAIYSSFFYASQLVTVSGISMAYVKIFKGEIAYVNTIVGGSGYTNGTYNNVALLGGSGTLATATIVVAGGVVTTVTIQNSGSGYKPSETLTASVFGGSGFSCKVVISSDRNNVDFDPKIRLLCVRDKRATESSININATPYTDYKIAYFDDPLESVSCSFQKSIDIDYSLFVSSLQKPKIVSKQYFINAVHLSKLTPHTMIFDRDSYYLVNSAKFTNGFISKFELFKIG